MISLTPFLKRNRKNIIFILLFLVLPWIFFKDSIKIGSVVFGNGDPNYFTLPLWDLVKSSIKNGEFPFWNKYIYSGFPLFANPQSNILYPFTLLFGLIFPLNIAYNLVIFLHYSLAGIFTYLFLNQYKLDKLASFAGGLIFMFSGFMICHKGHAQMLLTIIWTPVILLFLNRFRESRKFENILFAAILYGISFFGGHPQMFFYESMVIFLFILYYSFIYARKQYFFLLSLSLFLIGFLLILVQLLPIYELTKQSLRDYMEYGSFTLHSFPRKMLPTLFFPFIYGAGPSGVGFFGSLSFIETVAYFGITTIPFLIFGFFAKNKDKYFWIFIMVFSFILILGINTPFYQIMYKVPLYNKFRIPTRNWFEFGLAFSVISAFGFDYYIKNFDKRFKKISVGIIVFFSIFLIGVLTINKLLQKISLTAIINKMVFVKENINSLLKTTSLNNNAILIPIIFTVIIIAVISVSILKKNKYIYFFLILLIFLDLRYFGNFIEGNSDASYIYKDIKKIEEYNFINNENELFRIYPVVDAGIGGISLYPNRNIHYRVDSFGGYDALIYGQYNYFTGTVIMDNKEQAEKLLTNNNILSILNTKYIMYFLPENQQEFINSISKVFYENKKEILSYLDFKKIELDHKNSEINSEGNIVIGGEGNILKYFKAPINIESNKNYLISFEIKELSNPGDNSKNLKIDNKIFVDFFGPNYDNREQEFTLEPSYVDGENYKIIEKTIFSNAIPDTGNSNNGEISFRIFTYSKGYLEIKNLKINEVDIFKYDNYNVVPDKYVIILENKNVCPRFYFADKIIDSNNIEDAANLIWEKDVLWNSERFDPNTSTIVEKADFEPRLFKNDNPDLNILKYSNNGVILKAVLNSEKFLVFSDVFYPGWKAYVDGAETKIYRVNGIVKGVYVPEGSHTIRFSFIPKNFWIYFSISSITLIGIIITLAALYYSRSKKQRIRNMKI